MQYNNPDGKWSEDIPYMIINLEQDKDIYLGKTPSWLMQGKRTNHAITWKSMRSLNWQIPKRSFPQKVRALSNQT